MGWIRDHEGSVVSFNRTFMELKSNIFADRHQIHTYVLIVPLWN